MSIQLPDLPPPIPPIDVDPPAVAAWGERLLAAAALVDDLSSFAAGSGRLDGWQGLAALAYRASTGVLGIGAEAVGRALRGLARRVGTHAARLAELRVEHEALERSRRTLETGLRTLRADVARAIGLDHPVLAARAASLRADAVLLEQRTSSWLVAWRAEEADMVAAFRAVTSVEQVHEQYAGRPDPADDALTRRPDEDASPDAVRRWWGELTRRERLAVTAAAPQVIGALAGLPAQARHRANVTTLHGDLAMGTVLAGQGPLREGERRRLATARATATARTRIESRRDPRTGEPGTAQVLIYDPAAFGDDGAVAIGAGDLDSADHVAVIVPGFDSEGAKVADLVDRAADLQAEAGMLDPGGEHAVLVWPAYDAPNPGSDGLGVLGEAMAADGGARLAATVEGLRASRADDPAHLSVIGHSYGSTAVGHAAHTQGLPVDEVIVVGSPGLGAGVERASDLGVEAGHVWAGAAADDPITHLADRGVVHLGVLGGAGLGADPVEDDFGATRFEAEPLPGVPGRSPVVGAHQGYFDPGSESLHNLAHIVGGQHDLVHRAPPVHDPWWGPSVDPERERAP